MSLRRKRRLRRRRRKVRKRRRRANLRKSCRTKTPLLSTTHIAKQQLGQVVPLRHH
jgi:hypothetical protein